MRGCCPDERGGQVLVRNQGPAQAGFVAGTHEPRRDDAGRTAVEGDLRAPRILLLAGKRHRAAGVGHLARTECGARRGQGAGHGNDGAAGHVGNGLGGGTGHAETGEPARAAAHGDGGKVVRRHALRAAEFVDGCHQMVVGVVGRRNGHLDHVRIHARPQRNAAGALRELDGEDRLTHRRFRRPRGEPRPRPGRARWAPVPRGSRRPHARARGRC